MLLLVLVGLHNAWDLATFISLGSPSQAQQPEVARRGKDDTADETRDMGDAEHR
jgi:hypothetical protein